MTQGGDPKAGGFGRVAMKGSVLNSLQWVMNKAVTAVAMLVIAKLLRKEDYGVGTQALAIFQFLAVFLPLSVGDILIAHPKRFDLLAASARRLAWILGWTAACIVLLGIPVVLRLYDRPELSPAWLAGLLAVLAIRPLMEARLMLPLSLMRLQLRYPRIAAIDGLLQFAATILSVVMAVFGGRGGSLVVPQVVGVAARQAWYGCEAPATSIAPVHGRLVVFLFRAFAKVASAQYLHNVLVMLEILVLGYLCGDAEAGIFGLAFRLAIQSNGVIAFQLGLVLQPIFGHLQDDPDRQVAGFLKAQRVLGAVCVPICLAQAAIAEPIFRLVFGEAWMQSWQGSVQVFQIVSVAQTLYFVTGPSMACLRAQRRFGTFLAWQAVQLSLSVPVYTFAASRGGALGVAVASAVMWGLSSPLVVWMCTWPSTGRQVSAVIGIFLRPWLVALPIFASLGLLAKAASSWGLAGDLAVILVGGPLAGLLSCMALRWTHPDIREVFDRVWVAAMARVRRKRPA